MIIIEFFRDTISGIYYLIYAIIDILIIVGLFLHISSLKDKEQTEEPVISTEIPSEDLTTVEPVVEAPKEETAIPSIFMQAKAENEMYKKRQMLKQQTSNQGQQSVQQNNNQNIN